MTDYAIHAQPAQRSITGGAVVRYEITGGEQFWDSRGMVRTHRGIRWYYFRDRDRNAQGGVDHPRRPRDPYGHAIEIEWDADDEGQWTVLAVVRDMNGREFFVSHAQWVEPAWTVLDRELRAARTEGLPDIQATHMAVTRYLRVLALVAQQRPPTTARGREEHAALVEQYTRYRDRLGELLLQIHAHARYKLNAVHVESASQRMSRLRIVLARAPGAACRWKLVDWTNPIDRTRTGVFERTGDSDYQAIDAVLGAWDSGNRYPDGRIRAVKPLEFFRPEHRMWEVQTDASSTWDSVAAFFEWIALGAAVIAGTVTLLAPVPGSQVVSAAIWTSIFTSSAAAVINIAQRREEGFSDWRQDALDGLTIVGNVFAGAGAWAKGATIITRNARGQVVRMTLIGQVATDGVQGVLLAADSIEQYDRIMGDASLTPKQRTDRLLELFRSAAIAGTLTAVSIRGTTQDIATLGRPDPSGASPGQRLARLRDPAATVDTTVAPAIGGTTSTPQDATRAQPRRAGGRGTGSPPTVPRDGHTTSTQDDHGAPRRHDASTPPPTRPTPPRRRRWSTPPAANARGMRDLDDQVLANKARESGKYIVVRDGNPDGVRYIGRTGDVDRQGRPIRYEGKPETMKAKTATEGPYRGLVCFDPNHARTHETLFKLQTEDGHFREITREQLMQGRSVADLMADPASEFRQRYDYFRQHKVEEMGFRVLADDHYVVVHAQTGVRYHGDYDLHGVYNRDGSFVADTTQIRQQLNDEMGARLIQHGAHDEWPDRQNPARAGQNAGPQPPITIYTPEGEKIGISGGTLAENRRRMKQFYEERGLAWRYDEWESLPGNRIDTSGD